jgi:hypothetical protein
MMDWSIRNITISNDCYVLTNKIFTMKQSIVHILGISAFIFLTIFFIFIYMNDYRNADTAWYLAMICLSLYGYGIYKITYKSKRS